MSTEEQKRKEAKRIMYECFCAELEIQSREHWTPEEVLRVQEDTFQRVLKTGLDKEEIIKIAQQVWESDDFDSPNQKYLTRIANLLYRNYPDSPPTLKELSQKISDIKADNLEYLEGLAQGEGKEKAEADKEGLLEVCNNIERQLKHIKKLNVIERKKSVTELWENFIKHEGGLYKTVPAKLLGQTDLTKARYLSLTTSEQPITNLSRSIQHGEFKPQNGSENPIAPISGKVDFGVNQTKKKTQELHATAELKPKEGEEVEIVKAIADQWGKELSSLGILTEAVLQVIIAIYRKRKTPDNRVVITIQEIAEQAGATKQKGGSFQKDALASIREAVRGLTRINIIMKAQKVRGLELESHQSLFDIEYIIRKDTGNSNEPDSYISKDRREENWNVIVITAGRFLRVLLDDEKGLIKGKDFSIYKLHAIQKRKEILLMTYLEDIFRNDWSKGRGIKNLKIKTLLINGMGYKKLERYRAILEKLESCLETALEHDCISHFEYPPEYTELIDNKEGKRLTPNLFNRILDLSIYIEAGNKYKKHYENFRLTHQSENQLPAIIKGLKEYLSASNTSQALAAEELEITRQTISNYLSGKSKPPTKTANKIRTWLDNKGKSLNLPLF